MTQLVPGILSAIAIVGLIFETAPSMHQARGASPTPWPGAPAPAETAGQAGAIPDSIAQACADLAKKQR